MGVISGIVTYSNGQPSSSSYISASVGGTFTDGITERVKTDANGRFVLTWSGDSRANVVYLDGQEVAKDVPSGTSTLHFTVR
jgi:hypothetical protein